MAITTVIPPIQGKLRKLLVRDLTVALGLGTGMGYFYWYSWHLPKKAKRDEYYAKLQKTESQS